MPEARTIENNWSRYGPALGLGGICRAAEAGGPADDVIAGDVEVGAAGEDDDSFAIAGDPDKHAEADGELEVPPVDEEEDANARDAGQDVVARKSGEDVGPGGVDDEALPEDPKRNLTG